LTQALVLLQIPHEPSEGLRFTQVGRWRPFLFNAGRRRQGGTLQGHGGAQCTFWPRQVAGQDGHLRCCQLLSELHEHIR